MSEKDLGLHIKSLTDKIKASVDALLKKHNLTFSQTMIIGFLSEHGGRASQKEIENYLQVSHPTVVGIISRLGKTALWTAIPIIMIGAIRSSVRLKRP